MRTPSPACRLLHDRGRLLNLRVQACRSRRLGLRAGRHGHRSQHEERSSQCHRQFFQDTLPRFANWQSSRKMRYSDNEQVGYENNITFWIENCAVRYISDQNQAQRQALGWRLQ
jgi:hypothetical protein